MGRAEKLFYRTCLRTLDGFKSLRIPFTGVYGTCLVNWSLDSQESVRHWCKSGVQGLNSLQDGMDCVSRAQRQLQVLQSVEEETHKAINEWGEAVDAVVMYRRQNHLDPCDSEGIIRGNLIGMEVISREINDIMGNIINTSVSDDMEQCIDAAACTIEKFLEPRNDQVEERLESFIRSFYGRLGYKYEPFEWLYEGLSPILLTHVMQTRKGTPAALALALSAIGSKVGIYLLPMPLDDSDLGRLGAIDESLEPLLETLPSEVASRLNSAGCGPNPLTWILRLDAGLAENAALYVDCKEGILLTKSDMMKRFPSMGQISAADWRQQSLLRSWNGLIQLAIQAHQRRGESDWVAHWIYVKLAMDPFAPEWGMVL
ncbi:hypothetical protein M9434_002598 [Picochlorum sp. BPE23]|nr:hypothetical protein M9434_002598 [Picochlorum sp. BPE23]